MRHFLYVFFVILILFSIPFPAFAQPDPISEFDLCGKRPGETPIDQEEYDKCYQCLYNPSGIPREGYHWSVLGCLSTSPAGFTQNILQVSTSVIGGIGFVIFLFGGFKILTSQGDSEKLHSGKVLVTSSVIAMLIVFFSTFIYRLVAEDIIKLPGVG